MLIVAYMPSKYRNLNVLAKAVLAKEHKKYAGTVAMVVFILFAGGLFFQEARIEGDYTKFFQVMIAMLVPLLLITFLNKITKKHNNE